MKASTFDIEPMSTGEILDRTARLYRRHFLHTVAIVSLPYLLIIPAWALLGASFAPRGRLMPWQNPVLMAGGAVFGLAYVWLWLVSAGAMARSVSEHYLGGRPTLWMAYSPILRRSLSLLWAYLLTLFLVGAVLGGGVAISIGAMVVARRFPTTTGYVMAAVAGIAAAVVLLLGVRLLLRSFLVTQLIVIEDVRGWAAVKRGWKLMRPCARKALMILLFGTAVSFVVSFLFNFPAGIVMALHPGRTALILGKVWQGLGQILAAPFMMIAFTLLYYDCRIRQEAFDLEMMAQNLGGSTSRPAASRATVPSRPSAPRPSPPAGPQARPAANPPRPVGAFKVCPKCGGQVPNVQPNCGKCGTRVPYRSAIQSPAP